MGLVEIKIEAPSVQELQNDLAKDAQTVRRELSRSINDTVRHGRSFASRKIRDVLNLSKKITDKHLEIVERATPDHLRGALDVSDRGPLPLKLFKPRQTSTGVAVKVRKDQPQTIASAFGVKMDRLGHNPFKREGRKRLPIHKLFDVDVIGGGDVGSLYQQFEGANLDELTEAENAAFLDKRLEQRLANNF